jgi:hypothetical protein
MVQVDTGGSWELVDRGANFFGLDPRLDMFKGVINFSNHTDLSGIRLKFRFVEVSIECCKDGCLVVENGLLETLELFNAKGNFFGLTRGEKCRCRWMMSLIGERVNIYIVS